MILSEINVSLGLQQLVPGAVPIKVHFLHIFLICWFELFIHLIIRAEG